MVIEVAEANFYKLPVNVRELFLVYSHDQRRIRDTFRFELEEYRWNEIQSAMPDTSLR